MPTQPERTADLDRLTNEEVAGRLRIAVNRLQRRLSRLSTNSNSSTPMPASIFTAG